MGNEYLEKMLPACDNSVHFGIENQLSDKEHKWYGAVPAKCKVCNPHDTASFIRDYSISFLIPESEYYEHDEFYNRIEAAVDYLLRIQHEDGSIDLYATNFNSPPDTAFIVEKLCAVYTILKNTDNNNFAEILAGLKTFILRASEVLTYGGVHTPNHRWIVSAVLARINHLFPNPNYVKRIEQWLAEGVDMDADGQFSEKSTAIYTPMCVRSFITMARLLNKPELYEYVRKNLNMAMYYIHPGGEAVTLTSKRQDKDQLFYLTVYYYSYRYMAVYDNNGQYAAMADFILKTSKENFDEAYTNFLMLALEEPNLISKMPERTAVPDNYERIFHYSNYARIRRGNTSVTIAANSPGIMSLYKVKAILQKMRLSYAFFGKGQFEGEKLEKIGSNYVLRKKLDAGYFQALETECQKAEGRDWHDWYYEESRVLRERTQNCELDAVVAISEVRKAEFEVNINISGTDNVPVAVELGFVKGGKFEGVEKVGNYEDAYLLKEGYGKYLKEGEEIEFGPGHTEHSWIEIRGALTKMNADSVYLTGFTPFNHTLIIK